MNALGQQLREGLEQLQADHAALAAVRGHGLMLAVDFASPEATKAVVQHCLNEGKVILMTAGSTGTTVRFMPPLTVSTQEIDVALDALQKAILSLPA